MVDNLEQQCRFPDAGLSCQQDDRAGNEAAAEYPVEFFDTGRPGAGGLPVDLGDGYRRSRREHRHSLAARTGAQRNRGQDRHLVDRSP